MILVEAKFYPFLLMSVRGNGHSDREYSAMFDATDAVARRALHDRTKHVVISVSTGTMSAGERQLVAKRMASAPKELATVILGTYVIVASAAFRGVLTALRWLAPALVNLEPVASVDAAMAGAASMFERNGIDVDVQQVRGARYWLEKQVTLTREASIVTR